MKNNDIMSIGNLTKKNQLAVLNVNLLSDAVGKIRLANIYLLEALLTLYKCGDNVT